jgi:hypothetical protein
MIFDTFFTVELLLVVVVIAVILGGVIYLTVRNRSSRRETGSQVRTTGGPATGAATDKSDDAPTERSTPPPPPREFYKGAGLERGDENIMLRLYSFEEYQNELLGGTTNQADFDFIAAMKAYRWLDERWEDYPPDTAADVLELAPEDYEIDEEHSALLLRRLPPGLPTAAREDVL